MHINLASGRNPWRAGIAGLLCVLAFTTQAGADFALRDGDTVVFLGDSITAARTFSKIIENYTLLRFPERTVRFVNAGWGGDTAAGGLARLERDVLVHNPTVLIVAYGINDIGWGTKADDEHRQRYLDSVAGIMAACKARNVRLYLCSAAITAEDPKTAAGNFLESMCDAGMKQVREAGGHAIDLMRGMRAIQLRVIEANQHTEQEKDRTSLHTADGIHLNDLGQLAMAFVILKGLDAPAEVSSVEIDASGEPTITRAANCRVEHLARSGDTLSFDRLDNGLPLNLGLFGALQFRFIPVPSELNQYRLTITGLPAGQKFEIEVEGRSLGVFRADDLAHGANIASATADGWEPGGPWEDTAWNLAQITSARSDLATAARMVPHYEPNHPGRDELAADARLANDQVERLQRALVRPRPFHFIVRPAPVQEPQPGSSKS